MLVKIADGSQVELIPGKSKVILTQDVFGVGVGPFLVVGQEGDLPVILLQPGIPDVQDEKMAPVSPELILSVDNPDAELVQVELPDGTVVLLDAKVAPVLQALIESNKQLIKQLAEVLSGEELKELQEQLELAKAELEVAHVKLESVRGSLPTLEEAGLALSKLVEILKAV